VLGSVIPDPGSLEEEGEEGDVTYWVDAALGVAVGWQAVPDEFPESPLRDAVVPVPPARLALPGSVPLPAAEPPPLPPVRPEV
jgi:hypothetical protein